MTDLFRIYILDMGQSIDCVRACGEQLILILSGHCASCAHRINEPCPFLLHLPTFTILFAYIKDK